MVLNALPDKKPDRADTSKDRPPPENPNEALRLLAGDGDKAVRALYDLADDIEVIANYIRKERKNWHRMRFYVGCAFWLYIGLPIVAAVLFFMGGGLALFGN